jgi:pimeloyl-ACP methyl ester carboxylesterase
MARVPQKVTARETSRSKDARLRCNSNSQMIPSFILQIWLLGLTSLGIVTGAVFLAREWSLRSWSWDPILRQSVFAPDFGSNPATWFFAAAVALSAIALAGMPIVRLIVGLAGGGGNAETVPTPVPTPEPTSEVMLDRPDGSRLRVRFHGSPEGIPLVCTHGWGLNGNEWDYLIPKLREGFQIVTWDLPGLGRSRQPKNRDFSMENLAGHLEAVTSLIKDRRAVLVGHSIGGMITLTFCRLFPELLGERVAGLVLTHTTPTNPVRTTSGAPVLSVIEKPVLVPLMYLTIALSPLVRVMNWLSYQNGSAHLSNRKSSFGGSPPSSKVEFATRFQPVASPAVLARGMLAMMKYDARAVLGRITVPTLVVSADRDTTTKPQASREIHFGIPASLLTTFSPAKHLGLIEHDLEFAEAVGRHALGITRDRAGV